MRHLHRLWLASLLALALLAASTVAHAGDTRQDIYTHLNTVQGDLVAVRGESSAFHITAAQTALTAAYQELDAIRADLDGLSQDCSSGFQVQAFPAKFLVTHGQPFSYQFVACGGTAPYSYIWSGNLPAGLTFSASGLISGTVLAAPGGDFLVYPVALDSAGHIYGYVVWIHVN